MQAIQQIHDLILIEKWHCGKNRTAKHILHENTKPPLRVERRRWAEERVFRPPVGGFGNDIARRFSQHIFLRGSPNFLCDRLRAHDFNNMMIQKWHPALDGMPHFRYSRSCRGENGDIRPESHRILHPSERLCNRLYEPPDSGDIWQRHAHSHRVSLIAISHRKNHPPDRPAEWESERTRLPPSPPFPWRFHLRRTPAGRRST